jgi:hypothetical protein
VILTGDKQCGSDTDRGQAMRGGCRQGARSEVEILVGGV